MKVCTDSCLFGAWIAAKIAKRYLDPKRILDIGTGTGLLSLLLAQKTDARIDAVEIAGEAFNQSKENFSASPWSEKITAYHADIKSWNAPSKYDLLICNPPFFENDLLPPDDGKNIAKHGSKLLLEDLLKIVAKLLAEEGSFCVLLPSQRADWFQEIAEAYSLRVTERMDVKQTVDHDYFRSMLILKNNPSQLSTYTMSIKNDGNGYTPEFVELLKDYYLYL